MVFSWGTEPKERGTSKKKNLSWQQGRRKKDEVVLSANGEKEGGEPSKSPAALGHKPEGRGKKSAISPRKRGKNGESVRKEGGKKKEEATREKRGKLSSSIPNLAGKKEKKPEAFPQKKRGEGTPRHSLCYVRRKKKSEDRRSTEGGRGEKKGKRKIRQTRFERRKEGGTGKKSP